MQRVAIARALAMNENILFLDEPFSALDPNLRREMGDFFLELQRKENLTVVLVTHDQEEALRLAHRIALMKDGEILQVDEGEKLYYSPVNEYVARFMGKGNSILGRVEHGVFSCPYFSFPIEKEEGNYTFFFRERQLSFTKEIAERQIAERQIVEKQIVEKQTSGESIHEGEKISGISEAPNPFTLIEKEYLGEFFRAFYKNPDGQVLSCLIERGEELPEKGFPTLCFLEGEEEILFFHQEEK